MRTSLFITYLEKNLPHRIDRPEVRSKTLPDPRRVLGHGGAPHQPSEQQPHFDRSYDHCLSGRAAMSSAVVVVVESIVVAVLMSC